MRVRFSLHTHLVRAYVWDANGRLIERKQPAELNRFAYDYEGRLVEITRWDGRAFVPMNRYCYDGLARRVGRYAFTESGQLANSSTYRFDGSAIIREEKQGFDFNLTWDSGGLALLIDITFRVTFSPPTDQRGSVRGSADSQGQAVYNAFGETMFQQGQAVPSYGFRADLGWRTDGDAGLVFSGSGFYDPSAAVVLSQSHLGNINVHGSDCLCSDCRLARSRVTQVTREQMAGFIFRAQTEPPLPTFPILVIIPPTSPPCNDGLTWFNPVLMEILRRTNPLPTYNRDSNRDGVYDSWVY